jgi:hypothetical protein
LGATLIGVFVAAAIGIPTGLWVDRYQVNQANKEKSLVILKGLKSEIEDNKKTLSNISKILRVEINSNKKELARNIFKNIKKGIEPIQINYTLSPITRVQLSSWKAAGKDIYLIQYELLEKIINFYTRLQQINKQLESLHQFCYDTMNYTFSPEEFTCVLYISQVKAIVQLSDDLHSECENLIKEIERFKEDNSK